MSAPIASRTIELAPHHVAGAPMTPSWPPLAAIKVVDEMFSDLSPDTLDAIRMAAGELSENVVKFADRSDGVSGKVVISRTERTVEIRTANALRDPERATALLERLRSIEEGGDLEAQFVGRITEIIDKPDQQSTALGLIRVAYEGLFKLSCTYADATMTVVAARSIR